MADYVFEDPFDDSIEDIMTDLLDQVENIWPDPANRPDTREGSLLWTLLSPIAFEIQKMQSDLNVGLELGFLQFTFGEFLDLKGIELGIERKAGSNATGTLRFLGTIGTDVPVGTTASSIAETDDVESYTFTTTDAGKIAGINNPVSVNEIQKLRVDGTANFTITLDGQTTGSLPYNATDVQLKTALDALNLTNYGGSVGAGTGVGVIGNALAGATVEFKGTNTQYKDLPLMVVNPTKVTEKQKLQIGGTGEFRVLFDNVLSFSKLTHTSTIKNFIDLIKTEIAPLSSNYPYFTVTTDYTPTSAAVTNEFNIIFGGTAEYKDVPLIKIVPESGSTITPNQATIVLEGADLVGGLEDGSFVNELQKGRNAKPVATYANVNEIQSLDFAPAELEVVVDSLGAPAQKNRIEEFKLSGVPTSGAFKLTLSLDEGLTTYKTASIPFNATIGQLKSAIENTPNANLAEGDILITSPTNSTAINESGSIFRIEYVNNLRANDKVRLGYSDNTLNSPIKPIIGPAPIQTASTGANSKQKIKYKSTAVYAADGTPTGTALNPASGGNFRIILDDGVTAQVTPSITEDPLPYNISAGSLQQVLNDTITNPAFGSDGNNEIVRLTNTSAKNEIVRIEHKTTTSAWSSGSYRIQFSDGVSTFTTADIAYDAGRGTVQTALAAVVGSGNVELTGSALLKDPGNYFDIEFKGIYAFTNIPNPSVVILDSTTPSVPTIYSDVDVTNQQEGRGGWTGGSYRLQFDDGVSTATTGNISYNSSKAAVKAALEDLPLVEPGDVSLTGSASLADPQSYFDIEFTGRFATNNMSNSVITVLDSSPPSSPNIAADVTVTVPQNGADSLFEAGSSFSVTGGPLTNAVGLTVEFTGKNSNKKFKPITIINDDFSNTPISNNLTFTTQVGANTGLGNSVSLSPVDLSTAPLTQDIEAVFNDVTALGANAVRVRVANGVQTLKKISVPASKTFKITVDNGFQAKETGTLYTDTADAAAIQTAINALLFTLPGPYSPSVTVVGAGYVDSGNEFKIYFDSATEHTTNVGPLFYRTITIDSTAVFERGPSLIADGALYEIEYTGTGPANENKVAGKNVSLSAAINNTDFQPIGPLKTQIGDGTKNTKYFITLSHPGGYVKLSWGSGLTSVTSPISPRFDTAESIKYKLEELTDIPAGALTVTGGPFGVNPILIEFSGGAMSATDQPMINVIKDSDTFLKGGSIVGLTQKQQGHGLVGVIEDVQCTYKYTLVTKLGVQDNDSDPDYEEGYGETLPSVASDTSPLLTGNKVLIKIDPVISGSGLTEVKAIKVYRSIDGATFKLIGTITDDKLKIVELGDAPTVSKMSIVDNVDELTFNGETETAPTKNTTGVVELTAEAEEILDEEGNVNGSKGNINARTIENLDDAIAGIDKVTNPEQFGGGSDREDDEAYRARLIEFAQKDPGAGNIDDYVSWAKEITGVQGAAVVPEWQEIYGPLEGPGTVKVILSGAGSTAVSDDVIEDVRAYIAGTVAIPDPDQVNSPAILARPTSGSEVSTLEDGTYEYVYTYINSGKGETKPSSPALIEVSGANKVVEFYITTGQSGVGVQNTIGRRIYRRKLNLVTGDNIEAGKFCLVAEIMDNTTTKYTDLKAFASLPTPPAGPYQRRKAPTNNSTSLFDGVAPIGAHVSIESITDETVWLGAEIYAASGWSIDGSGGRNNLTSALDTIFENYFASLPAGQDVKIIEIMNILHDHPGVYDFRNTRLYSPLYPSGTTDNIPIGSGVTAVYSSAGSFSTWLNYPYDT